MSIDLGTRDAVRSALEVIGSDTEHANEVYIYLKNHINSKIFFSIPVEERFLFISHCLRKTPECPAEITEEGYVCKRCGLCNISEILKEADRLGYKSFIVPGGSMVFRLVKKYRPKACFGIACYYELEEAIGKLARMKISTRSVPLTKTGCVNTEVDVERVKKTLKE
jgi:hypothetical protein